MEISIVRWISKMLTAHASSPRSVATVTLDARIPIAQVKQISAHYFPVITVDNQQSRYQ